jgi:hypothetical protein
LKGVGRQENCRLVGAVESITEKILLQLKKKLIPANKESEADYHSSKIVTNNTRQFCQGKFAITEKQNNYCLGIEKRQLIQRFFFSFDLMAFIKLP